MTEELLKKLREVVAQKKENIDAQNRKMDRIKELEKDPSVAEYMQLRNLASFHGTKMQVNDGLYYLAYEECRTIGIYPNTPMYVISHSGKYLNGFRMKNYRQYKNIESFEEAIISQGNIESFEREYIILENIGLIDAHKEYLKLAIEHGEDEAIRVMSKKYRKGSK